MKRPVLSGTRELLNTLFVMTPNAYVHLESGTVRVDAEDNEVMRVPLHHLGGLVLFGSRLVSPALLMKCAEEGRAVTFLDSGGRFQARLVGRTSGNVLLREAQQTVYRDEARAATVARAVVAGKLNNERAALLRAARETRNAEDAAALRGDADSIAAMIERLPGTQSLDDIRGTEGQAAARYFGAFDRMILAQRTDFRFDGRSRRPPRDRSNALLSFLYTLLANDCTSAVEGVGLDPQFGYLHAIRPGRPALALDLMEEFRTPLCDRLTLTLINRKEISAEAFEVREGGAVMLNEEGRKQVITAYQMRKQGEVEHPLLGQRAPLGLFPHLQARILARHLRGELPSYVPFVPR